VPRRRLHKGELQPLNEPGATRLHQNAEHMFAHIGLHQRAAKVANEVHMGISPVTTVAQICNRQAPDSGKDLWNLEPRRMQFCDTADFKSALRHCAIVD